MDRTKRVSIFEIARGDSDVLETRDQQATEDSNLSYYKYDVFLSFRGPDTRKSFTDVLYDHMRRVGLRVFRDDDELAAGDMINKILPAIGDSEICVPIFSKTFASSKWCLREVARMVELNKLIIPIFYDVTPNDVKLKTPLYNNFMDQYITEDVDNNVQKWKKALIAVAAKKGKEVLNESYTTFCKSFVEMVSRKLRPRRKFDINPIGLEDRVQYAIQLLDVQSTGVRYLGIYGMGGIGKTTLAKEIVNKVAYKFDSYCFLENVRESVKREGIENLLKKLLASVDPRSAMQPDLSRMMEECFQSKKILIVLDDVDKWEQIAKLAGKSRWFGPGSRIIVTTRNRSVMENGKLIEDEVRNMEMETLRQDEALQLFNWHAFKEGNVATGFEELSKEAASTATGLPLALEIIGSYLHNKNRDIWKEVVEKLKKIPQEDVQKRLRISYDTLQDEQKAIFLDIACFFIGFPRSLPIYMWEACEFYPHSGIDSLCSMSLIKLTVDDKIWMHDSLRDLGREIVRQESPKNPANRSRLWEDKDAWKVLMSKKEKEIVEALCIDGDCSIDLLQREIGILENLRFLDLRLANLKGDFEGIFRNLKWLSYHCHENFGGTKFPVAKLVILDFSASAINEDWIGWKQLKYAENLKVLDLRRNEHLKRTPYFPEGMTLDRLDLSGCTNLEAIDSSIGNLKCLQCLNLVGCVSLAGLPEEVTHLRNLISVMISGGNQSFNLPESIGNMVELKFLVLQFLKLMVLPNSIGELRNLVSLDLQGSQLIILPDSISGLVSLQKLYLKGSDKLKNLPDTLGNLQSLVELDLTLTGIVELPKSMGRLKNLKLLSLSDCYNIKVLPDTVGNLKSLVKLQLSRTGITELPESIGGLESLEVIGLEDCQLKTLPKSFGSLKKLENLNAESADLSGGLPNEISGLSSLRYLTLSRTQIRELPSSINKLNHLHTLVLDYCLQLRELPDLPTNLIVLSAKFASLHRVYHLSKLQHLTSVSLDIDRRSSDSDFGISMLSQLFSLILIHPALTTLPDEFASLDQLKELMLYSPKFTNLQLLPTNLERLFLSMGYNMGLPNLPDLKKLSILVVQCRGLVSLPNISHLKNLSRLSMVECWSLIAIPGLGKLKSLQYLQLRCCHSLTNLENLSELKEIQNVLIHCCGRLCGIEGVDSSKISSFQGGHCQDIQVIYMTKTSEGSEHQVISGSQNDIISLLSSPGRDFLIGMDRRRVLIDSLKGKKVFLYFGGPFWESYTFFLMKMYSMSGDFEVINVSSCSARNFRSFNDCLDRTPWPSIPPSDLDKCGILRSLFKVDHRMPKLVVFDERGELVTQRGFEILGLYGLDAYPFTTERIKVLESITEDHKRNQSLTSIFSEKFLSSFDENQLPISKLEGKIVGIYFSSSSVEECDKFTHRLVEVYQELKSKGGSFEIVGAPIEANVDAYLRIFRTLPWPELREFPDCLKLYSYFSVSTLPTLVIIGSDGKILQPNAVNDVEVHGAKAYPFTDEHILGNMAKGWPSK